MGPQQRQIYALKDGGAVCKHRPVVVVSRNELNHGNDVTVIYFTSQRTTHRDQEEFCIPFYKGEFGLWSDCFAKVDSIARMPIAQLDLMRGSIGEIDGARFKEILDAIKWTLKIE